MGQGSVGRQGLCKLMFASTYSSSVCWGWHVILALGACRQSFADVHVPELDVGPVIHVLTLVVLLGFVILEIFGWSLHLLVLSSGLLV